MHYLPRTTGTPEATAARANAVLTDSGTSLCSSSAPNVGATETAAEVKGGEAAAAASPSPPPPSFLPTTSPHPSTLAPPTITIEFSPSGWSMMTAVPVGGGEPVFPLVFVVAVEEEQEEETTTTPLVSTPAPSSAARRLSPAASSPTRPIIDVAWPKRAAAAAWLQPWKE